MIYTYVLSRGGKVFLCVPRPLVMSIYVLKYIKTLSLPPTFYKILVVTVVMLTKSYYMFGYVIGIWGWGRKILMIVAGVVWVIMYNNV